MLGEELVSHTCDCSTLIAFARTSLYLFIPHCGIIAYLVVYIKAIGGERSLPSNGGQKPFIIIVYMIESVCDYKRTCTQRKRDRYIEIN